MTPNTANPTGETIVLNGTAIEIGTELFKQRLLPPLSHCVSVMREQSPEHQAPVHVENLMAGVIATAVGAASAEIGPARVVLMLERLLTTARNLVADDSTAQKH